MLCGAGLASAQLAPLSRAWRLDPVVPAPSFVHLLSLTNPNPEPVDARVTAVVRSAAGHAGDSIRVVRTIELPATGHRDLDFEILLPGLVRPFDPISVTVECLNSGSTTPCPDNERILSEQVVDWRPPAATSVNLLLAALGPRWLDATPLGSVLGRRPSTVSGEAVQLINPTDGMAHVRVRLRTLHEPAFEKALLVNIAPRTRADLPMGCRTWDIDTSEFASRPFAIDIESDVLVHAERTSFWPWTRNAWASARQAIPEPPPPEPALEWYFAMGSVRSMAPDEQETYFIITNPSDVRSANVQLRYYIERGRPIITRPDPYDVNRWFPVGPRSRVIIRAGSNQSMDNHLFATTVRSGNGVPVTVTRVFQWGRKPNDPADWTVSNWEGGHVGTGVRETSMRWAFSTTSTQPGLQLFFPVLNPTSERLSIRGTFIFDDGAGARTVVANVPPFSRRTLAAGFVPPAARERRFTAFLESIAGTVGAEPVPFVAESVVYWEAGAIRWGGRVTPGIRWTRRVEVPSVVPRRPDRQDGLIRIGPVVNVLAWLLAAIMMWWATRRTRRDRAVQLIPSRWIDTARAGRMGLGVVLTLALVAFYSPSSVGGSASRWLTILSLVGTATLLGLLAALPAMLAGRALVVNSLVLMALLTTATVFTPLPTVSPGVPFIFLALALTLCLDLRRVRLEGSGPMVLAIVHSLTIAIGFGLLFKVRLISDFLILFYTQYYSALLPGMFMLGKPVGIFATHSLAGFMYYLLFYLALLQYRAEPKLRWLALAAAYVALLAAVSSTTSSLFLLVAVPQVLWAAAQKMPRIRVPLAAITAAVMVFAAVHALGGQHSALVVLRGLFVGDRMSGFGARFGADGLLAGDVAFIAKHPLSPIGFAYSDLLYFGDCGIVLTLLRGGFPAVACIYGGLLAFLWTNLRSRRTAVWLWFVTTAFEIGFQPLMSFRFVAFLPFYVVCANAFLEPAGARQPPGASDRGEVGPDASRREAEATRAGASHQ
jgi:hypothetical protein